MPRVRFTLRWMTLAVAIVAVIFGGEAMRRKRSSFLALAAEQVSEEQLYRRSADVDNDMASRSEHNAGLYRQRMEEAARRIALGGEGEALARINHRFDGEAAGIEEDSARQFRTKERISRARAEYHADLRRKYENAARRPWWGMTPLPTEPDWDAMLPDSMRGPSDIPAPPNISNPFNPK